MSQSTTWAINSSQLLISSLGNVLHLTHNCSVIPTLLGSAALLWHHISNNCVWKPLTKRLHPSLKASGELRTWGLVDEQLWSVLNALAFHQSGAYWQIQVERKESKLCWPLGLAGDSDQVHGNQEPPPSVCAAEHNSLGQWFPCRGAQEPD